MTPKNVVVGITGASGAAYAVRLLECLTASGVHLHLVVSPHGRQLLAEELELTDLSPLSLVGPARADQVTLYRFHDVGAVIASGSFMTDGMVVCPCSGNTLAQIASGTGDNLLTRAAAVHLKEARRLIVVPREMPLSAIEIENMLRLSRAGGTICPACPGFYLRPARVQDLVDFVVGKICDLLSVPHDLPTRWRPPTASGATVEPAPGRD